LAAKLTSKLSPKLGLRARLSSELACSKLAHTALKLPSELTKLAASELPSKLAKLTSKLAGLAASELKRLGLRSLANQAHAHRDDPPPQISSKPVGSAFHGGWRLMPGDSIISPTACQFR
jgi:hypothetical protein